MKTFLLLATILPSLAFASDVTICGRVKDNGDSIQIMDNNLNPYIDLTDIGPKDPANVIGKILSGLSNRYCVTGTVQAFDSAGKIAFEYVSLTSAKQN